MPNLFKPDLLDSKPIEEAPSEDPKNENTDNTENKTEEKPDTPLQKEYAEIQKWDEMNLAPEILRGIYAYGYEIPSPIQKKAIQPMIDGRDLIAQAQSGTGKTATFTIGSLMCIDKSNQNVQVICLSPTRGVKHSDLHRF